MRCFFIFLPYFLNLFLMDVKVAWLEAMTNIYFLVTFFLGVNTDFKKLDAGFLLLFGFFDRVLIIKLLTLLKLSLSFFVGVFGFAFGFGFGFALFNFISALAALFILLRSYNLMLRRLSFSSNSLRSPGDSMCLPVAMDCISGPVKCIALSLKSLNASIVTGTRG